MGKVVKFTGSKLLGAELRRLRGGRSLKQIADLTKAPPLSERIAPISAPTLSQIENGISFPSLETIHSLAQLYKRPVQQLLDLAAQDRLAKQRPELLDIEASVEAYAKFVEAGDWHAALAVATQGERAATGDKRIQWRINRAQVLENLGFGADGVSLLQECLDHPDLPAGKTYLLHEILAMSLASAGLLRSAALHQAAAAEQAPDSLETKDRLRLEWGHAYLTLRLHEDGGAHDERALRQALRQLEGLLAENDAVSAPMALSIRVHASSIQRLLGNHLVAQRDLEQLAEEAREQGNRRALLESLAALGALHRDRKRLSAAKRAFEEASQIAVDAEDYEWAFKLCFAAYECCQQSSPREAELLLRRCERYYPLLTARTPAVIRFEAVTRGA